MDKVNSRIQRKEQEKLNKKIKEMDNVESSSKSEDIIVGVSVALIIIGAIAGGLYFAYSKLPF